jgi:hypothetical protein
VSPADGDIPPVGEEIHLPGPSAKPAVLALGTTILLLGVTWSWMVVAIGAIIVVLSAATWIADTRRDIDELPPGH